MILLDKELIDEILIHCKFDVPKNKWYTKKKWEVYLMIYDHLFGKGIIGGGLLKRHVLQYENAIHDKVTRMKIKAKVSSNRDLLAIEIREPSECITSFS